MILRYLCLLVLTIAALNSSAQYTLSGEIRDDKSPLSFAKVRLDSPQRNYLSDEMGRFSFLDLPAGSYTLTVQLLGYANQTIEVSLPSAPLTILLEPEIQDMDVMVVSGTLKEVSKKESAVNVEVYTPQFFKKNPSPSIFDALQNVNGVRPQLNCNICNTGDIHVNGLEGPYTMVLIDGMPIVSSLSTVYGLSGIPNSLVERIEIVKGPASALYGSEAIGGIINIITKKPQNAPLIAADVFTTSWLETNVDVASRLKVGKKAHVLTGLNYYNYDWKKDENQDGFTDVTLQDRISVFQKWNFQRKDYRLFTLAGRYLYEDRWGGQMNWTAEHRGTDSIYAESIYTTRWEVLGAYQLPLREKVFTSFSFNQHWQNSYYGVTPFMAKQFIGFGQVYWDKKLGKSDLLVGMALRHMRYDDNSSATQSTDSIPVNLPSHTWLPGLFAQNEIHLAQKHKLLLGLRFDYHSAHGPIFTPRIGYKWDYAELGFLRFNAGTGYRIVNIFTEDHAALTGARTVIIEEGIRPEQSYNMNVNLDHTFFSKKNGMIALDFSVFYTYFTNRIIADYDSNPDEIRYANLTSHAVSQGISLKVNLHVIKNVKAQIGGTLMDIANYENGGKQQQILTEKFSGNWSITYEIPKWHLSLDYTGNVYSPMRLPLLNDLDPRPGYSPWWSLQNIQLRYDGLKNLEIYVGLKNLLNWTPAKSAPFLIAGSSDPFDQQVSFDTEGNAQPSANNPYGLTFDPSYVFAPNQGIRFFLGVRYTLK